MQVASQIDTTEETETVKKGHKGIMERFNDKITEDESDQEKAQDIIVTVQRHLNKPKQSFLDRESEKLIREQDEELANDEQLIQEL